MQWQCCFFFHPPKSASSLTLPRQQWAFQREPSCLSTKHALRDQQVEVPSLFRWKVLFPNLAKIYIFSHVERFSLFYIFKPYVISKKQVIYTMGLKSFNKWYLFYLLLFFSSKKVDICFVTFFFFFSPFTGSQSLGLNFTLQNLCKHSGVLWQSWPALMWGYLIIFFHPTRYMTPHMCTIETGICLITRCCITLHEGLHRTRYAHQIKCPKMRRIPDFWSLYGSKGSVAYKCSFPILCVRRGPKENLRHHLLIAFRDTVNIWNYLN